MHVIDLNIMKLSRNKCTIEDFTRLLVLCESKQSNINYAVVNENKFYFPEDKFSCNMNLFPLVNKDPNGECSPIICCASGNNYVLLKATGEDFVLDQHTSITAFLLNLSEGYEDVRVLDAKFDDDSSVWLVVFNGSTSN